MSPSIPEPTEGREQETRPDLLAGQHFPPLPKQERSRRKRDALLQSALVLFAERGYEETSIEGIARHAHVAVGGFYKHFVSKRQILLVLMDHLLQEASSLTLPIEQLDAQHVQDVIASLVRQGLQVDWSYAGAYRAWREAAVQDRELRELNARIERWAASLLESFFRVLLQVPGARREVDVVTLAWELSLLFLRLAEVPLETPEAVDAVITSLTNLIHHGLFTDDTSQKLEH